MNNSTRKRLAAAACLAGILATATACGEQAPAAQQGAGDAAVGAAPENDLSQVDGLKESRTFPAKVAINGRKHKGDAADAPGAKIDAYKADQSVPVKCQDMANGEIWDKTTDGWWVPDKYVKTGYDSFTPGIKRCADDGSGNQRPEIHGDTEGPAGPKSGSREEKVKRVIEAAKSQTGQGYLYSWGAGGKGGPAYGIHHYPDGDKTQGDDYNRFGYDCSGLTQYAFWKGAGVDIGSTTVPQYDAGKQVSLSDLQVGDLVFWGDGDNAVSTTHVAIWLGDNKILEAATPRDKNSVRITEAYGKEKWTAHAIRVL